ncbi:MAG: hypothetical protein WEB19_00385 [Acidimicrobiia bacterium]
MTTDNLLSSDDGSTIDPRNFGVPRGEALMESARLGSGIATVYEALDRLVDLYALDDAALVVDVPGLGLQVLHAGRKPLGNDERGLLRSPPGLYLEPPLEDPALDDLMLTVGALGLRLDLRASVGS